MKVVEEVEGGELSEAVVLHSSTVVSLAKQEYCQEPIF